MSAPRLSLLVAALIALFALGACGDDDDDTTTTGGTGASGTTGVATGGDLDRYCELTQELDEAGNEQFQELEDDPNATEQDFEDAERDLVNEFDEELDELQEVAPEEISADVNTLVDAVRFRAGLLDEEPAGEGAAEKRISAFEKKNC